MGKRVLSCLLAVCMAVSLAPFPAYAQTGMGAVLVAATAALSEEAIVQQAFDAAKQCTEQQGFQVPALKDAVEHELAGARCYSIAADTYYIVYEGVAYVCDGAKAAPKACTVTRTTPHTSRNTTG